MSKHSQKKLDPPTGACQPQPQPQPELQYGVRSTLNYGKLIKGQASTNETRNQASNNPLNHEMSSKFAVSELLTELDSGWEIAEGEMTLGHVSGAL